MLEQIDLSVKLTKEIYKQDMSELEVKLAGLQREARNLGIPVVIVLEGWEASGKGTQINKLILPLDPRGFNVWLTKEPNEEEYFRPFLWRFWNRLPASGRIAIFDRSWYIRPLDERIGKVVSCDEWKRSFDEIRSFERQLSDSGAVIVKLFLHISKKEQKKRFIEMEKNPYLAWKVSKSDWKMHKKYDDYRQAVEEAIGQTDTDYAPWTIVESHDERFAAVKIFTTVINAIQSRIDAVQSKTASAPKASPLEPMRSSILDSIKIDHQLTLEEYESQIDKLQKRFLELEHEIYMQRIPLIICYEGWDAAGKGGNIRRLVQKLDPRGYEVIPVAAPNDIEKAHHYLWRFWTKMPKAGHITIFDRTWYGRVMVERIEGFCSEPDWKRAYREINEMERQLTDSGAVLCKFWLQIDKDEQLRRFNDRQNTPEKQWKITEEDWRNRDKWDVYKSAVDEMLFRTGTVNAPWTIVEANCKYYARVKALKTVIERLEERMGK